MSINVIYARVTLVGSFIVCLQRSNCRVSLMLSQMIFLWKSQFRSPETIVSLFSEVANDMTSLNLVEKLFITNKQPQGVGTLCIANRIWILGLKSQAELIPVIVPLDQISDRG